MAEINVVKETPLTPETISEDLKTQPSVVVTPEVVSTPTAVQVGDKTPPNLLLKSLQEERDKRKELEEELENLKSSIPSDSEVYSDEGKALQSKISTLTTELSEVKGELAKKDLLLSQPILKDKWDEFEKFRSDPENKGMNLRTAAKAFLTEMGLLEPQRKGLEKTTGGPRVPMASGMSVDDVANLRKNNFKKYQELLKKGLLKIED